MDIRGKLLVKSSHRCLYSLLLSALPLHCSCRSFGNGNVNVNDNVNLGNREGPTTLPQDPKADPAKRKKQLDAKKKDYRWSTEVRSMWRAEDREL